MYLKIISSLKRNDILTAKEIEQRGLSLSSSLALVRIYKDGKYKYFFDQYELDKSGESYKLIFKAAYAPAKENN